MGSNFCHCLFLIFTIISISCLIYGAAGDNAATAMVGSKREHLETVNGGGGGGYNPAPPRALLSTCLPPNIIRDYHTIQNFKSKIADDPNGITKSWNNPNPCTYKGFDCAVRPDTDVLSVAAAKFNGFRFGGKDIQIKDFIDQLKDLAVFHANSNDFTGIVPKEISISNINFLYEFDISNNKYTGGFPSAVLDAKNLTILDIRFNQFSGLVPKELFTLDLDVLFINNNQFTGNLPDNVGDTPALYLSFANNFFTGPIPSSIGSAKNLLEVLFLNNKFSGCLPYEIGFLSNSTLFDVSYNELTGPMPHSFACLANIEVVNMAKNEFYGPVPEIVCKLPKLQNLSLSSNYFTQVGPECRKLMALNRLDVANNCILDLPNQRSAAECKAFFSKPRICPNEKSLTYVPCRKNSYLGSTAAAKATTTLDEQSSIAAAPAPGFRTYDALSPNNLQF